MDLTLRATYHVRIHRCLWRSFHVCNICIGLMSFFAFLSTDHTRVYRCLWRSYVFNVCIGECLSMLLLFSSQLFACFTDSKKLSYIASNAHICPWTPLIIRCLTMVQIWYSNVPHPGLVSYKKDQNWVKRSGEKLLFPGGGTQFKHGAHHYIEFIQQVKGHSYFKCIFIMHLTVINYASL